MGLEEGIEAVEDRVIGFGVEGGFVIAALIADTLDFLAQTPPEFVGEQVHHLVHLGQAHGDGFPAFASGVAVGDDVVNIAQGLGRLVTQLAARLGADVRRELRGVY